MYYMKTNLLQPDSKHFSGDVTHLILQLARKQGLDTSAQNDDFFHRLRRITEAFARALEDAEETVTFRQAAEFSLFSRAHRRPSTLADLRSYINRMCSFPHIPDMPMRSIRIVHCRFMLQQCFGHSAHTYRKAQSVLHSIFNCAMRQGWCSNNPAKAILRPPVKEKRIEILSLYQIRALLNATRQPGMNTMEAALRLMLWCGIRPAEMRRLSWSDIDPEEGLVYVEGAHSKTGGARAIPLRGGADILRGQVQQYEGLIAPLDWERKWKKLRHLAGLTTWQNDALRHTFASMHLKRFHNLPLLQEEMGHRNSALLQTRYLNLRHIRKNSATRFFQPENWS